MKRPSDLTKTELVKIVNVLHGCLYLDDVGAESEHDLPPFARYWNPNKAWDVGMLETLAEVLQEHDLVPDDVTPASSPKRRRSD